MLKHFDRTLLCVLALSTAIAAPATDFHVAAAEELGESSEKIRIDPSTDWPWWRGPGRNGIASPDQSPPLEWTDKDVLWKHPVPGRGHGSPMVLGGRVYLATADKEEQTQSILAFDRDTGNEVWQTVVHRGPLTTKGNRKASLASSTVASDGERLFINFLHDGAIYTTALSLDGKQLWQARICKYVVHQGYGASPAVYDSLVIVSADNKGGGAIVALDRKSGREVWRRERPSTPNYASPIILEAAGRTQLVFTGCDLVTSLNPLTGEQLWEIEGSTTECVTSPVTNGKLVYTSGGYPRNHVSAIRADGSGETAWEIGTRVYVPSMLFHQEHLYAVSDSGVAMCWNAATGEEVWKHRLQGGFTASPVLVNDVIYATSEKGMTFAFKAQSTSFELLGKSRLGDQVYATPTFVGGRIYTRVAHFEDGQRQEVLYAIGGRK